ncbi:MAG: ribosome maturation factor RimP [Acidimicrobiia bacterium]
MAEVADEIWQSIERYVGAEGLELDDLEVAGGRGAPSLRVVVDAPDGVDVDHLADLSRGIDRLLEGTAYDTSRYGLEVSSPGLERKLRRPSHWAKAVGRRVVVKTRSEIDGSRRHEGELLSADDTAAQVVIGEDTRAIPYDDVTSARTVFVWEKSPKPGAKKE